VFILNDQSGGCGQSFQLVVVADEFNSLGLLDRQRKVNEIIADEIASVHALELKTWTSAQWETKKASFGH
jgi:stress-induced morphogen